MALQWIVPTSILVLYLVSSMDMVVIKLNVSSTDNDLPFYCVYCYCKNISDGIITNCSGKGLFNPPRNIDVRTKELYLSRNLIKVVKYSRLAGLYNLRKLDLSENTISSIEIGAFRDLTNLTQLLMNGQLPHDLFILQRVLLPGVFKGLTSLKVLHVHNCLKTVEAYTSRIPTEALKVLTALEELRIDGVVNVTFSEDFRQLKNLSTVVMSGFSGLCLIGYLDSNSFVGLENLKNLTINKCRIQTMKTGTFWWTPKLNYLDMSWNTELEIYHFGKRFEELKYTNLKILKINAIHNPHRAGTEILRPDVKYLRDLQLIELYMDDNGIEFIDYGVFQMFPKTLKRLYLRRNKLNFGLYLYEAIFNNPNLEILNAGDQELVSRSDIHSTGDFNIRQRRTAHVSDLIHIFREKRSETDLTLNLKTLICSGSLSALKPIDFNDTFNNISFMDLSRNLIPKIESNAFEGLNALLHLNLSNNYIETVVSSSFNGLRSLKVLDLKNNLLGYMLKQDKNGNLFSPLVRLKVINLSKNRITALGKNVFRYVSDLESIDLSDNYIENLDIELSSVLKLKLIDLRFNRLQAIPVAVRTYLNKVSKQHTVTVDLSSNQLQCTCTNIPFLKWLFYSEVKFPNIETYYCSLENNTVRVFNESGIDILEQLENDCKSYLGIIVGSSTGSGIIIAFLVSYLVYYNRWKLRYVYYMAKIKLDGRQGNEETGNTDNNCFPYDVFISYGDRDRAFVVGDMLQNLEVVEGKRLNIRDRDFELGEVIAVNISKAIRTSKKTFLMLSRHFLRNKWCNFEMNMARMEAVHMKRKVIVIIFLEPIPANLLPLELLDLLRECPNTDLPKETSMRVAFWQKCVDYLNE